ncbi:MAG TPA: hypothetical protein VFE46_04080 [Pirellulales bacterium]|jgi:hypothetical protein|nr:hypothetical protein [Pirellulales bacterium]
MHIRDRIKELRRVPARDLRPNPKNWRIHPAAQQDALRGVLAEIGYAGALLARELDDGSLELIDGHLRAETTPDLLVPVLVLDLSHEEADKLLATYDPLSGMATVDLEAFHSLLAKVPIENAAVQSMLDTVANPGANQKSQHDSHQPHRVIEVPELFQIVVECDDEAQQQQLFEQLTAQGYKCRVLTL